MRSNSSRLWCIFEIAAFRHANPTGKFRVAPLYVESTACAFLLFSYFIGFLFYGMSVYLRRRPTILETVIAVSPTAFLLHGLRWNNNSKTKLFSELKNFKLDQVHCSEDFDREYVLSAIASWYGSAEDFENHVRGQLSLEIASSVRRTSIPASHCFLQTTLSVAQGLQPFVSIWKCGASSDFLLRYLIAAVLAQCVFWIPVTYKLVFYLCHRFSEPVGGRLGNALQSLLIFLCWLATYAVGYVASILAYERGMEASVGLALVALVVACLVFRSSFVSRLEWTHDGFPKGTCFLDKTHVPTRQFAEPMGLWSLVHGIPCSTFRLGNVVGILNVTFQSALQHAVSCMVSVTVSPFFGWTCGSSWR